MARTPRKHYSREFKLAALSRVQDGVRSMSEVARELGLNTATVRQWKRQLGPLGLVDRDVPAARPGVRPAAGRLGQRESIEAEVLRLRREVAQLRQERDILKKAAAFFARDER